jgi:hypothetical protein
VANDNDQRSKDVQKRNLSIRILNLKDDSDEEDPDPKPPRVSPMVAGSPRYESICIYLYIYIYILHVMIRMNTYIRIYNKLCQHVIHINIFM